MSGKPRILNFIGGELVEPRGRTYIDNIEPATGESYSQVADSDAGDVELAVVAAGKAFPDCRDARSRKVRAAIRN